MVISYFPADMMTGTLDSEIPEMGNLASRCSVRVICVHTIDAAPRVCKRSGQ
jgi:hypothetical protein